MLSTFDKVSEPSSTSPGRPSREKTGLRTSRIAGGTKRASAAKRRCARMPEVMLDTLRESSIDEELEIISNMKQVPAKNSPLKKELIRLSFSSPEREDSLRMPLCLTDNCSYVCHTQGSEDNYYGMDSNGNSDAYYKHFTPVMLISGEKLYASPATLDTARPAAALEFPPPPLAPPSPEPEEMPFGDRSSDDDASFSTAPAYAMSQQDLVNAVGLDFSAFSIGSSSDTFKEANCSSPSGRSISTEGIGSPVKNEHRPSSKARGLSAPDPLSPSTAVTVFGLRCSTSFSAVELQSPGAPDRSSQPCNDKISVDSGTESDPNVHKHPSYLVVVAIDFGTAFSGYAYSFVRDPEHIHVMRKWEGGDPGLLNQKVPTCLLLTPGGHFHSFGYAARDFFHNLENDDAKKWMFFDKFKMVLHGNTELNESTAIAASNGVKVSALKIFACALNFFKEHALKELGDQSGLAVMTSDVKWVITVPAIWKQPAKQFMRQAAYQARLADASDPDQLTIALEPEAASIYCRRLKLTQLVPEVPLPPPRLSLHARDESEFIPDGPSVNDNLTNGSRYMVVDCGGGTVDITVHELDYEAGRLNELHRASGGPYGSVGVDARFEVLLKDIFSAEFVEAFKRKRPAGYIELMVAFESRKRSASPYRNMPLNVSLPFSLIDYYKKQKDHSVETAIRKYNDPDVSWSAQGMLRLTQDAMRRLFLPTIDSIKQAVGDVLNHPEVKGIKCLFLVGGFAESPWLQYEMRKDFSPILQVIIPQDVSMSIVKGAVMFGLDPAIVKVRRCRLTYGVGVLHRFVTGKHPASKLIRRDGADWCTDVFDKLIAVNQPVLPGDAVTRSYTPANVEQKSSVINLYCSDRDDVRFVTDSGVRKCATLRLNLSPDSPQTPAAATTMSQRREIQARVVFGDTEIKVTAVDVVSGACAKAVIDFLTK